MVFEQALKAMKNGSKAKLPSWGGLWRWDEEKKTIIMHTKDGKEMDIRETQVVEYTLKNVLSDEWIIADEVNCPQLGGEATFAFGEAIKYLKRGMKSCEKGLERKETVYSACDWNFIHNAGWRHCKLRTCGNRQYGSCICWNIWSAEWDGLHHRQTC